MGSTKGVPHMMWKQKDKLKIVKMYLEEGYTPMQLNKKFGVNRSLVSVWVKLYLEHGAERLISRNGTKRES